MTKNEDRINKLFKELVPETGKADSLAGELVRAMSRIGYRFYNDGDQLGIGYGKETCNPAGRFLGAKGNDKIAKLTADAWAVYSEEAYEKEEEDWHYHSMEERLNEVGMSMRDFF